MGAYLGQHNNEPLIDTSHELGISGMFGLFGSSCSPEDVAKKHQVAITIDKYLTGADKRDLVSGMENQVPPNAKDMAQFFMGGRDCKHKNVTPGDQRFLDRLPQLIKQRATEAAEKEHQEYLQQIKKQDEAKNQAQSTDSVPSSSQNEQQNQPKPFSLTDYQKLYVAIGTGLFVLAGTAIALK